MTGQGEPRATVTGWLTGATLIALPLTLTPLPGLWIAIASLTTATYAVALTDPRIRRWWR